MTKHALKWNIRFTRKERILAEFSVPFHKMTEKDIGDFLRASVIGYSVDKPVDALPYYVNRRRGHPTRLNLFDVKYTVDLERSEIGYFCGDWDCLGVATYPIEREASKLLAAEIRRGAS